MGARPLSLLLAGAAALLAAAGAAPAAAQEGALLDRIVAVVNGEVISLGQLERAVENARAAGPEATAFCTPPANPAAGLPARVLECMIDDLLQFQHVRRFPQFDVEQQAIDAAFERLVQQYDSREAFDEALQQQGRTAAEVRYDLEREALVVNYINARYRQVVNVSAREIQRYYDEVLGPEMERQGAEMPALEAVDNELIEPLLIETEVNRRVDEWIADLRRRASIIVYTW